MAIRLTLPHTGARGLIGFAYSPAFEALLSLRTVVAPKQHPLHLPWARRCRDLTPDLLEEIHRLSFLFRGAIPGFFELGLSGDFPTIEHELERLVEFDDTVGLYEMTLRYNDAVCGGPQNDPNVVNDPHYQEAVLARARAHDPEAAEILTVAFDDPRLVRQRVADMLSRYWDEAFAEEWQRIEPRLDAVVTTGARLLVTSGINATLDYLVPEAHWDPDTSTISLDKPWDRDVDVASRGGLSLVPSMFASMLMVEADDPWPLCITTPLPELRSTEVKQATDREVAEGLRALGDETRLQIARMVATEPRSTKELAELLSLSESAVSRHLKTLAAADIVAGERDGYYVLYRLRENRIGQLGGSLRKTLGLGATAQPTSERQALDVVGPRPLVPAGEG